MSEIDIARAQAGLEATTELLNSKTAKLRFLEKKMLEKSNSQESLMAKMLSTIRGDADSQGTLHLLYLATPPLTSPRARHP